MDILTVNDAQGAYPASYYAATARSLDPFPAAQGQITCDVCVVGGGFSGLSAALHLAQMGYDVVLLEAQRVGFGASGRNGGQVGTGQRADQDALETLVGQTRARALWDIGLESVQLVRDLIATHDMDCGWSPGIVHAAHRARFVPDYHAYAEKLHRDYGYDQITPLDREAMRAIVGSDAYHGGELDMGGGHIHPLRFAFGLARAARNAGVRIFEGAKVTGYTAAPGRVMTDQAEVAAGHILLCCNGYLGGLNHKVSTHVMPINNFIAATPPLSKPQADALIKGNYAVADSKFVVNYFRLSEDNRLLFGGGESYGWKFPSDIGALVRRAMVQIYPHMRDTPFDFAWGGTLAITLNRMPHFARLAGNVISISGYSGHGVAMATMGGKMAAGAIAGQAEKFDVMAGVPTPRFPGGAALRWPLLVAGMLWYGLRDRL